MSVHPRRPQRHGLCSALFRLSVILCVALGCMPYTGFAQASEHTTQAEPTLRLHTELVSLAVTITDKHGRAVAGLTPQSFAVFEDGVAQQVNFFRQQDGPVSVVIVFDASGSMTEHKLELAHAALAEFVAASHPEDEYSLIAFNQKPHLLVDRARGGDELLRRVAGLKPSGRTALFDAVAAGIAQATRGNYTRRTLLVVSDGEDNHSRIGFEQLRRRLQEFDAIVYAIGATTASAAKPQPDALRSHLALERMAEATGGRAFFPQHSEALTEVFSDIALELRRQYTLAYTPTNFVADGKWRRIKVRLDLPGNAMRVSVRHRPGYYAVAADARRVVPEVEE